VRVCIHRGTKEIGGTCVEIESLGQRIVLDVGLPLDARSKVAPKAASASETPQPTSNPPGDQIPCKSDVQE
jgi:hypothetical protein